MCRDDMPCKVKKSTIPGIFFGRGLKKWKNYTLRKYLENIMKIPVDISKLRKRAGILMDADYASIPCVLANTMSSTWPWRPSCVH